MLENSLKAGLPAWFGKETTNFNPEVSCFLSIGQTRVVGQLTVDPGQSKNRKNMCSV